MEDSRLLPVHLNFVRLLRLWSDGGFYMGFSFLLVRPIPVGERIIDLGPNWMEEGNTSTRQSGSLRIIPAACGNEMMLQLPARDPLLACVLSSYSRYFSTEGHVQEVGPCGIEVANLEHPSIIHLRALHNKPKESIPSPAK